MNVAFLGILAAKSVDMAPTFNTELTCLSMPTITPDTSVVAETPVTAEPDSGLTCLAMPTITPDTLLRYRVLYDGNGADASVNCLSGGTPSASSTYSSYVAGGACDGNTGNYWMASGVTDEWWKYDFGEGVTKAIHQLKVYLGSYSPKDFIFQGSNNDSDWDNLISDTFENGGGWQTFHFYNDTAYRYYRLYIVNCYGSRTYVYEIEMAESCEDFFDDWVEPGETYYVLEADYFVRSGYVLSCWNTQADGGGTDYDADETFAMPAEAETLYAKWTEA
jgi:hypothetical protein